MFPVLPECAYQLRLSPPCAFSPALCTPAHCTAKYVPTNPPALRRRQYGGESEHGVAIPPLFRTALVWGLFMGVSSNTRYQIVFGLERIVDQTIAKRIPQVRPLACMPHYAWPGLEVPTALRQLPARATAQERRVLDGVLRAWYVAWHARHCCPACQLPPHPFPPQVAYGTTVAIRFINNVIGGENFIDMARWAGIQ